MDAPARLLVQNGGFEAGTNGQAPPSWIVTPYLNPGVTISTPQTRANLNLQAHITGVADPTPNTYTVATTGGVSSQLDPTLGNVSLRWPVVGGAAALVNQQGKNQNANSMKQSLIVTESEVDPVDARRHLRMLFAPVLQDPGHNVGEQPYVFVQATRVSGSEKVLYSGFWGSNQPTIPWQRVTLSASNVVLYTDWTLVDVPLDPVDAPPGTVVELEIIAAGCSPSAHWGQAYVDEVGAFIARPIVFASGPAAANENTNLTYTVSYENAGPAPATGVVIEFNTPSNTTFSSIAASGLTCTLPTAGTAGMVSCEVGSLLPGAWGRFDVTVHVNAGTSGSVITASNYHLEAAGLATVMGSRIDTQVTSGVIYADLGVSASNGVTVVAAGAPVSYAVTVSNAGPNPVSGAQVSSSLPSQLTGAAWTCAATGGASCTVSGTGALSDSAAVLPVGGTLTYTVTGTVAVSAIAGPLAFTASVSPPSGAFDPQPLNDVAVDRDQVTAANGVACSLGTDCTSGVCGDDLVCGYPNGTGPCTAADMAIVCRSGWCSESGLCMPVGACLVDADCPSGWCDVSVHQCNATLANGVAMPSDAGHVDPVLDGTCSAAAATLVCASGVCDADDDLCGYADGAGPCTAADAASVCRSGTCSESGLCMAAGSCLVDTDCSGGWCDVSSAECKAKLANGVAMPSDAAHGDPALDGICSTAAAALVCASGVCDPADDLCGLADGAGPCTAADAATVCRSGTCAVSGSCVAASSSGGDGGDGGNAGGDDGEGDAGGGGGGCSSGPSGVIALALTALGLVRVRRRRS